MGILDRFRRRPAASPTRSREADDATAARLREFLATRRGVEAWLEPATSLNQPSILLVAHDGEWLRRAIPSPAWGQDFCDDVGIPAYPAGVVPYPQRMRDHNARMRRRPGR